MAAQASTTVRNEVRIGLLRLIRTKITVQGPTNYHKLYGLPKTHTISIPNSDEAVYHHDHRRLPLYVSHLENGLRLPLHPFIKEVCGLLGVSPSQFTPNAIAILMGFLVLCHRVGVEPSLCLFNNLVGIKTKRKDAHYFFHYLGGHKVVSNGPEMNRDWNERFVWVIRVDPILAYRTWPEIKKEALKPCILSAEEGRQLEKIRSYVGSREMSNLFDPASLRVARISGFPPSETSKARAALLAVPLKKAPRRTRVGRSQLRQSRPRPLDPRSG